MGPMGRESVDDRKAREVMLELVGTGQILSLIHI